VKHGKCKLCLQDKDLQARTAKSSSVLHVPDADARNIAANERFRFVRGLRTTLQHKRGAMGSIANVTRLRISAAKKTAKSYADTIDRGAYDIRRGIHS
jgi:hypothetical protein